MRGPSGDRGVTASMGEWSPSLHLRASASVIGPPVEFSSPKPLLARVGTGSKQGTQDSSSTPGEGGEAGEEDGEEGEKGGRKGAEGGGQGPAGGLASRPGAQSSTGDRTTRDGARIATRSGERQPLRPDRKGRGTHRNPEWEAAAAPSRPQGTGHTSQPRVGSGSRAV